MDVYRHFFPFFPFLLLGSLIFIDRDIVWICGVCVFFCIHFILFCALCLRIFILGSVKAKPMVFINVLFVRSFVFCLCGCFFSRANRTKEPYTSELMTTDAMTISARYTGGFYIGTGKYTRCAYFIIDWLVVCVHFCYILACETRLGVWRFDFYMLISLLCKSKPKWNTKWRVAYIFRVKWLYCVVAAANVFNPIFCRFRWIWMVRPIWWFSVEK